MSEYRLYGFDHHGKIAKSHQIFADDDDGALQIAGALDLNGSYELWNEDRFVSSVRPQRSAAPVGAHG